MHPLIRKYYLIIIRSSILITKAAIVDQFAKWWFISYLKKVPGHHVEVFGFFNIVYAWNYGISFGMFSNYYQYSNTAFLGINIIIVLYIYYLLLRSKSLLMFFGYSAIVGGAIGNIIDRIIRGAVFDFLDFHIAGYHFPAFNIADSFITMGIGILIYDYYKRQQRMKARLAASTDPIDVEAEKIRKLDREIAQRRINKEIK